MKPMWGSILLAVLAVQTSHGMPEDTWKMRHSSQVAQPYVVNAGEFDRFPRFPLPATSNNRRQDNWQPLPRPNSQAPQAWARPRRPAPFLAHPNNPQQQGPAVRVKSGEQVAIVFEQDHNQKEFVNLENLLSILKNVPTSADGAHHVYVAPPHYHAPQGHTRFNATYLENEAEIHRNPPAVYVAPVHYRAPEGYHRLPLPTRWVNFDSQQSAPLAHQGSIFISTTAAPLYPQFEQTIAQQAGQSLEVHPQQELQGNVEEPISVPEPSTTTATTPRPSSTTGRLVLAADRPSFLGTITRRPYPVQRPLITTTVTTPSVPSKTTSTGEASPLAAPQWPEFQQVKRPTGAPNRLNLPYSSASIRTDGSEAGKGDQLTYGQKLKSKEKTQLSSATAASDKLVSGGSKGAVVAFTAEDDEPILETGEAFQLSESQNTFGRPPKIPSVSLLKPTATEAPKVEVRPLPTSTPSTPAPISSITETSTSLPISITTEDDTEVTATTFNAGRFTKFLTTTETLSTIRTTAAPIPQRGDQRFQEPKKTETSSADQSSSPAIRPSLNFSRPVFPTRYSPYEIVRQMQKQEEVVETSTARLPYVVQRPGLQTRPIPSAVHFTESNQFRGRPAWGTEEDLGRFHEGFSPLVPGYGVKQGHKSIPLIKPVSEDVKQIASPKLPSSVRIRPQTAVVVEQELEDESDWAPMEELENGPPQEEAEDSDYEDLPKGDEEEGEAFEQEQAEEDLVLAASAGKPQLDGEITEIIQDEDTQFGSEEAAVPEFNGEAEEGAEETLTVEEVEEQYPALEASIVAGNEAVQAEETASIGVLPADSITTTSTETPAIMKPAAAGEPERQEDEAIDKRKEEKPGKHKDDKKAADKFRKDKTPSKVLGVSTATEVSLMYEICFKGKCVKVHE